LLVAIEVPLWLWNIHLLPLWIKLVWLFVFGATIGSFLNVCILRIPERQSITGRSRCNACGTPIRWWHNLPVLSWLILRGRCASCGARFSFRYFFVEVLTGSIFAALYWWEVAERGLYPPGVPINVAVLHWQYLAHAILACFLILATFIDFDHFLIPDEVTVPGTLLALVLMTFVPVAQLPHWTFQGAIGPLTSATTIPVDFPLWLRAGQPWALVLGLLAMIGWCAALFPWQLIPWAARVRRRAGPAMARACYARHALAWDTILLYVIAVVGSIGVTLVWLWGDLAWIGLLTALAGLGIAGGIMWSIRITAQLGMGREALGFGDVTLLGMIGAWIGWQAALMSLFLSAFYGLAMAVVRLLFGDSKIQYGPAICLGALTVIVSWGSLWDRFQQAFVVLGNLLILLLPVALAIMLPLLVLMRMFRERFIESTD
jgi:prepilin signal peptidase PulO-like enzyme (type II secretory pathway)